MNVKLRRIEVFMAVVECGGFSAAAARLHVAQSAVSAAVKALEEELGTVLFERAGRGTRLTGSGRLLRERAGPPLDQLYGIAGEIRDLEQLAVGRVRIAAPALIAQIALEKVLPPFMKSFPGVQLRVLQAGTREIEQMVLRGEADLGMILWRELTPELQSIHLLDFENVACVPPGHPRAASGRISWAQLLASPQAVYPAGYHQRALVESYAAQLRLPLRIAVEAENTGLLVSAVRAGLGVTTLPAPALRGQKGVVVLRLPQKQGDRLRVGVCWLGRAELSRAARELLGRLQAYAASGDSPGI